LRWKFFTELVLTGPERRIDKLEGSEYALNISLELAHFFVIGSSSLSVVPQVLHEALSKTLVVAPFLLETVEPRECRGREFIVLERRTVLNSEREGSGALTSVRLAT